MFLDNDSAQLGLVKGYSPAMESAKLVMAAVARAIDLKEKPWYARVPTGANLADPVSRLEWDQL